MTFFDTATAVITDPLGTTEHLLKDRETPPFLLGSFALIILTLFLPALIYQYRYGFTPTSPALTGSFVITIGVTAVFFLACQIVFLRILGVSSSALKILAAMIYAALPIVPVLLAYYASSYFATGGRFDIAYYLATGRPNPSDWYLKFLPYFLRFENFCSVLIFAAALKAIGQMSFISGLLISILSIGLLLLSLFVGLQVGNAVYPDTYAQVWHWIVGFGNPVR